MAGNSSSFDVYAAPYVPLKLRQVNSAPATIVRCTPAPWIDFPAYIQTFVGTDFIRANSRPSESKASPGVDMNTLDRRNYSAYFSAALMQETMASRKECDEYALYQVQLFPAHEDPRQSMYRLVVPGLRESSLQIEVGDIVCIRQLRYDHNGEVIVGLNIYSPNGHPITLPSNADTQHDSVVWAIDRLRETLSLRIDGLMARSMQFNASFTVQSARFDALQSAVLEAEAVLQGNDWMRSMLFPRLEDGTLQTALNSGHVELDTWDRQLNYEQLRAIQTVLHGRYGQVPYLVTGPPGTGKTKTVVETALQLIVREQTARLLVCAPSDSASDMLVKRLRTHLNPHELFRLNSPARSFPEVPNDVLPFCYVHDAMFSLPPFPELMRKKIVVTTCRDAEILRKARVSNRDLFEMERRMHSAMHSDGPPIDPPLHWTALLVDEAAQATEPEMLISLLVVAPPDDAVQSGRKLPSFVMVGDQNQLGPRTASKAVALQRSLFERVLLRSLYSNHPLARSKQMRGTVRPLTKAMLPIVRPPFMDLVRNYRSHPAILVTPSSLFYNDTLEPSAEHVHSLLTWSGFAATNIPVLFADNRSQDEVEQDRGGWFNVGEAQKALQYAQSMLHEGLLQQHEICIMSPFRAQVRLLRMKARSAEFNMPHVNIGPLEAFQGLESRFVIICTTRTRNRFIEQDVARGLGIIHEPRRFCVGLTRAKEGLVVIGNPQVLLQDESWASFIAFCWRNKAWSGHLDDWQLPHGSKIRISRLEKQMAYRNRVSMQARDVDGITRKVDGITFGMSEEEAFYESGISAESIVRYGDGSE